MGITTSIRSTRRIVSAWQDIDDLIRQLEPRSTPGLLIEDAGHGAVAVGPILGAGAAGCIHCYVARRAANGARQIRPVTGVAEKVEQIAAGLFSAIVAGGGNVQIVTYQDGRHSHHHLLPMPGCRHCWPLADKVALPMAAAVDHRLGIVSRVETSRDPLTDYHTARAFGAQYQTPEGDPVFNHGFAADTTQEAATTRAIGEALERYAGALGGPAANAPPGPADWPEVPTEHPTRVCWIAGKDTQGRPVSVPARRIRMPYRPGSGEKPLDGPLSSTGMAAAQTPETATIKGLCEVIERDAFMRSWRHETGVWPLPRVSSEPDGMRVVQIAHKGRLPIVAAFFESDQVPFTAAGLAGRTRIAEARQAAVREAIAARIWVCERLAEYTQGGTPPPLTEPRTLYDHAIVHACNPALITARDRWLSHVAPGAAHGDISASELIEANPNAIRVDLTTPDIAQLGVSVVRIVQQDRIELDCDALAPALGGCSTPHPFA